MSHARRLMSAPGVDVALDNDVILKAVCFGLPADFWPGGSAIAALGAAPFVLAKAIARRRVRGDEAALRQALDEFFGRAAVLDPTDAEAALAADLQYLAQRNELALDTGEAQLAAMVVTRRIAELHTGDKRAIAALEELLDSEARITKLAGRIRCLEQLVAALLADEKLYDRIQAGICAEPDLDKALAICFACGRDPGLATVLEALASYIENLRASASRVLAA